MPAFARSRVKEETMTDEQKPKRRGNGTYEPGTTGNPNGRPKKDRRIPHPETIRDTIYDVADFEMLAQLKGKTERVSLLQANLLTLGLAGAAGDKASARAFLGYVQDGSEQELRNMDRMMKRIDRVTTPAYELATDPAQRAELLRAWNAAVAEALGTRQRTTRGFPKRKRKI